MFFIKYLRSEIYTHVFQSERNIAILSNLFMYLP